MKHAALFLALLATACTTVGPDYAAPTQEIADAWVEPVDARPIDPAWWRSFDDPILVELIEQAIAGSPDVAEARARLREARANRDAVLGRAAPQGEVSGSATQNRISENGQIPAGDIPGFDTTFSLFDLGFDASWELDFWGRRVREGQAAEARVDAAAAGVDQALVVLTAEVARSYLDLRAAQAEITAAEDRGSALGELERLTVMRFEAGIARASEAERAGADTQGSREAIAQASAQAAAAAYRIAALLGAVPESVVPGLLAKRPVPRAPETILAGLRSDLLRRRPDVRQAERDLAATSADIGVATADLFPRFSLLGSIGTQSRAAQDIFDDGSLRFIIGPQFSWPIFSGGQVRAGIRAADARADGAAARYERAVAEALADSESAINRYLRAQEAQTAALAALANQRAAFALAERRFDAGEDNRLVLERARIELVEAQRRATARAADASLAAVSTYKALGGAWQAPQPAGSQVEPGE